MLEGKTSFCNKFGFDSITTRYNDHVVNQTLTNISCEKATILKRTLGSPYLVRQRIL